MFKELRTGTKIVILCGTFIVAIGATVYSLIGEKQIAIEFAKKELVGSRYLAAVRGVYADVLVAPPVGTSFAQPERSIEDAVRTLDAVEQDAGAQLQTRGLARALSNALRSLSDISDNDRYYSAALKALAGTQQLVSRIADDSNLALDPDRADDRVGSRARPRAERRRPSGRVAWAKCTSCRARPAPPILRRMNGKCIFRSCGARFSQLPMK